MPVAARSSRAAGPRRRRSGRRARRSRQLRRSLRRSPSPPPPTLPRRRVTARTVSRLPVPRVAFRLPRLRVSLHAVVQVHEPGEPSEERPHDREQRPRVEPAVHHPSAGSEQQNREREGEAHRHVFVALPEAPGGWIRLLTWHRRAETYPLVKNFASKNPDTHQTRNLMWRLGV